MDFNNNKPKLNITMKEMILNAFKALGFELEELGELGYGFEYEGAHYLWLANLDDDMLTICMPGLIDKEDVGELPLHLLMDKINGSFKFVKSTSVGDSAWLFYEHELLGEENFEKLLPHMVIHLEQAYRRICEAASEEVAEAETKKEEVDTDKLDYRDFIYEMPD